MGRGLFREKKEKKKEEIKEGTRVHGYPVSSKTLTIMEDYKGKEKKTKEKNVEIQEKSFIVW